MDTPADAPAPPTPSAPPAPSPRPAAPAPPVEPAAATAGSNAAPATEPGPAAKAASSAPPPARPSLFGPRPPMDPERRTRGRLKMVGAMMVLSALMFGWMSWNYAQAADHEFAADEPEQYAGFPGGVLRVEVAGTPGANITATAWNGTALGYAATNGTGLADLKVASAAVRVHVEAGASAWDRNAFVPQGWTTLVRIDPASSPASTGAAASPDFTFFRWFWAGLAMAAVVAAAGVAAFRARVYTLALVGSAFYVVLALAFLQFVLGLSLPGILFAALAGYTLWTVYKARVLFGRPAQTAPAVPPAPPT